MTKYLITIPLSDQVGLSTISQSIHKHYIKNSQHSCLLTPFTSLNKLHTDNICPLIENTNTDLILDILINHIQPYADKHPLIIIEGMAPLQNVPNLSIVNQWLAQALDANIIFITTPSSHNANVLSLTEALYSNQHIIGHIINQSSVDQKFCTHKPFSNVPIIAIPFAATDTIDTVQNHLTTHYNSQFNTLTTLQYTSPSLFRYQLIKKAQQSCKRILLPEGEEKRIIIAAQQCAIQNIAKPILIGDPITIKKTAQHLSIELHSNISIIDPNTIDNTYVTLLMEKRKHKNITREHANQLIKNPIMLGTLMLENGDVDGLVAGAVHTTAETIKPALMIIKTLPNSPKVSSIFFMGLPNQVFVYGDCAVNTNPSDQELADIAIQAAESAKTFGIPQKVAMISYSTGASGSGPDIEKVRSATRIAQQKRPDLMIDGPLQYDAAYDINTAQKKMPNSPVAGKATIYIFPDLNTANTTYKAVQRHGNIMAIGPMLQGLRKPVNDLSRGASIHDIIFTVAITAIQSI